MFALVRSRGLSRVSADNTAPEITCPANPAPDQNKPIQVAMDQGKNFATVTNFKATASDNSNKFTVTNNKYPAGGADASGVYPAGPSSVLFTAKDLSVSLASLPARSDTRAVLAEQRGFLLLVGQRV